MVYLKNKESVGEYMTKIKDPYRKVESVYGYFDMLYGSDEQSQRERYQKLFDRFKREYNCDCGYIASSSGRVEVCGNHTDHNGGRVISCAVSLDTLAVFLPSEDGIITIKSEGYPEIKIDVNKKDNRSEKGTSAALTEGVVRGFLDRGLNVGGFNASVTSNILSGAGISSSASFELLIAEILNFLYNGGKADNERKALIAQFAEREYFGKPCGLLDQTAISFGGLKLLDFSDRDRIVVKDINNNLKDFTFVLINTGGSHENLTDEYAAIPRDMLMVAKELGRERLIEISEEDFYERLPAILSKVSDRAVCRAIHFYDENKRVDRVYASLNKNEYEDFLKAISESGISSMCKLQNCYVPGSGEEPILKALFIAGKYLNGGANRVHGGGFAGTILNVVNNDDYDYFADNMKRFFGSENIIPLKVRCCGTIVL